MGFRRLRGDRPRLGAGLLDPVEAAVVEARAEDDPTVAEPGAAAVLVHARTDVEVRRNDVGGLTAMRAEDQRTPPAFLWPAFGPVDAFLADVEVGERDAALAGEEVGRDRRGPGPVRGSRCHPAQRIELEDVGHEPLRSEGVPDAESEAGRSERRCQDVEGPADWRAPKGQAEAGRERSEEHTSELQSP